MSAPAETDKSTANMPESPTTARPFELDDDDTQETGVVQDPAAGKTDSNKATPGDAAGAAAASTGGAADDVPPPKPPRPLTETQKNELILKEAFPSVEDSVIKAVLRASRGQVEPAFHALLEMTDPDATKEDEAEGPPPPQPPRPAGVGSGMSQLEADEQYARQLAEHYERQGGYDDRHQHTRQPRDPRLNRQQKETGLKPNELFDKEHSFLEDDLPVIRENLRKGFLETQTKVNSWITNFKKRLDDAFEEEEAERQQQQQHLAYGRRPGESSRRSGDYDRYDADPQLITDDFAGMKLASDGTPIRDPRPLANPNLFKPPPPSKSPKPNDGRRVAFRDETEEIDAYTSSPKLGARDSATPPGNKQSKWQPLSAVEPSPITDNDPFSLGDSEDEKEVKDKTTTGAGAGSSSKDTKDDDAERLRKAAAEAMADSLVDDKSKTDTGLKS
ncbi:hypothetical protein jhhlp_001444 [Lomentospora prolificans]|uniref:CUE domain-containing protein n=1 Tax=Lomentospora prolificans TaxID=41688 RepID=A0A2N3NI64_9PEZI|nr:hypothetical protein jhhlp_001444 [Lomentospora prolificans]